MPRIPWHCCPPPPGDPSWPTTMMDTHRPRTHERRVGGISGRPLGALGAPLGALPARSRTLEPGRLQFFPPKARPTVGRTHAARLARGMVTEDQAGLRERPLGAGCCSRRPAHASGPASERPPPPPPPAAGSQHLGEQSRPHPALSGDQALGGASSWGLDASWRQRTRDALVSGPAGCAGSARWVPAALRAAGCASSLPRAGACSQMPREGPRTSLGNGSRARVCVRALGRW